MKTCYLQLGLKLKKKHCVLEFSQSKWLRLMCENKTQDV